jgi:hypothetical protein
MEENEHLPDTPCRECLKEKNVLRGGRKKCLNKKE